MLVKVIFARSATLGGLIVRLGTMSDENHVAIQVNNDIYEAQFAAGVIKNSLRKFEKTWDITIAYEVDLECSHTQVIEFLEKQLGKRYDWRAIVAMPFRSNWQKDKHWFCSELVAKVLNIGGFNFPTTANRITPRDLKFAIGTNKNSCECDITSH